MTIISMAAKNCTKHNTKKTTPRSHSNTKLLTDLPWEVICNIMSRTPLKSIFKFRTVSNTMNNILQDPYFTSLYSTHQSPPPNIILFRYYEDIFCFEFLEKQHHDQWVRTVIPIAKELLGKLLKVVASYNGLLLLREISREKPEKVIIIYNPVTRELKTIGKTVSVGYCHRGFYCLGFDSKTNTYKFIAVYNASKGLFVAITTIGVGLSSWEKVELPIELDGSRIYRNTCKPVFFNGEFYTIITSYLLVIDISSGICRLINIMELSPTVCGQIIYQRYIGLYKSGMHLFLLQLTEKGVNTWQLVDANRGIFGQKKEQHHRIFEDYHVEFAGTVGNGEFLFKTVNKSVIADTEDCYEDPPYTLVTCDLETGKLSHVYGSISSSCDALPFVATLTPFCF